MTTPEIIFVSAFAVGTFFIVAAIANALYFHFRYQKQLDQKVMKSEYYDSGILLGINRLMVYGHYCFSPKRADRDGVKKVFDEITRSEKRHLKFHWVAIIASCFFYFSGYVFGEVFGLMG